MVDECHRGSARDDSRWREILDYFSSATDLGITDTPKKTTAVSSSEYFGDPLYTNFDESKFKFLDTEVDAESHLCFRPDDILIQRANSLELVGTSAVYHGPPHTFIYPDLMMKCCAAEPAGTKYVDIALKCSASRNCFIGAAGGSTGNMPKISQGTVIELPISLPQLAEQTAIDTRAVLREAFAPAAYAG